MHDLLKRQKTQEEALLELETKTTELFMQNIKNNINQAKEIQKMTSGNAIKIETLENAWNTIATGIDEKKQIEEKANKKREQDKTRLQAIKKDCTSRYYGEKRKTGVLWKLRK